MRFSRCATATGRTSHGEAGHRISIPIRFHGILDDEVGLYDPERRTQVPGHAPVAAHDASIYNFSYVDQIYDGLLEQGVRPFVELSFMPRKLAAVPDAAHPFWYHPDPSAPKDYAQWDDDDSCPRPAPDRTLRRERGQPLEVRGVE